VPRRSDGRTHKQYERYYLGIYLLALAEYDLLTYPLKVAEGESPDFILRCQSGATTGLEVTRATDQALQQWLSDSDKRHPENSTKIFSPLGYAGDQLERKRCDSAWQAIENKIAKLARYRPASRYDLFLTTLGREWEPAERFLVFSSNGRLN
jgi:hypothetical protein